MQAVAYFERVAHIIMECLINFNDRKQLKADSSAIAERRQLDIGS